VYRTSTPPPPDDPRFCFYCGGVLRGPHCARCGLASSPAWPFARDPICPRCALRLEAESLGGLGVEGCKRCHGCFLARAEWDDLLARVYAREHVDMTLLVPAPPGAQPSADLLFRVAECPACGTPMDRCAFATRSKTTVDVCAPHGIWLDGVELVALIAILTRRLEGIEIEIDPAEQHKEALLASMREITEAALALTRRRRL
jgi:Zn-finger nucleic acid-binding protein